MTIKTDTIQTEAGGPVVLTGQSACKVITSISSAGASEGGLFEINVSSITDTGVGDSTANYTNAFSTAAYICDGVCHGIVSNGNANDIGLMQSRTSTSAMRVVSFVSGTASNVAYTDYTRGAWVTGDLA